MVLAFTDYELGNLDFKFVGLANFGKALADPVFRRSLWNTLRSTSPSCCRCAVGLGLLVAILVHGRKRTRSFYEVVYFLPVTSTLDRDGDRVDVPAAPEARPGQRVAATRSASSDTPSCPIPRSCCRRSP